MPIFLLSNLDKIIEKLKHKRLHTRLRVLNGLFQKKSQKGEEQGGGRLRIYFSEKLPGNFRFVTLPQEISEKKSFYPWNSANLCDTPWKF